MSQSVNNPAIFDSLPYFDNDLEINLNLQKKVDQELSRELKQQQGLHPLVPPPYELFSNNDILKAELSRVENHEPLPAIDTIRYQLPAPTSIPGSDEEWLKALQNAKSQLEHQRVRQDNLTLLQQYGSNSWRVRNYLLESTCSAVEKLLEEVKERTTDVNRSRKKSQTALGNQLNSLESRWTELISNILQMEMATVALEDQIVQLGQQETELSSY